MQPTFDSLGLSVDTFTPASARPERRVGLSPASVLRVLAVIILVFGLLHLAAMPVFVQGTKASEGIYVRVARFIMLQNERSIPTWFSIILIGWNVVLLGLTAMVVRRTRSSSPLPWLALAAVFSFLSLDEMMVLHERVGNAIGTQFHLSGVLTFPWVITGSVFTLLVGLGFTGFLLRLPRRTAALFLASGGIFVGGALGFEMVEAATVDMAGFGAAFYLEVLVEEMMEMFGQALFSFALLDHLAQAGIVLMLGGARPARG